MAALTLLGRALRRRCPLCGQGAIFRSHFKMNHSCPNCRAVFWKDPGESLGAMYMDYVFAIAVFIPSWILLAWLTKLTEIQQFLVLAPSTVVAVLICYPWSRSFWTLLVYISGGMERPAIHLVRGGRSR